MAEIDRERQMQKEEHYKLEEKYNTLEDEIELINA
jgi:hypothetical protein